MQYDGTLYNGQQAADSDTVPVKKQKRSKHKRSKARPTRDQFAAAIASAWQASLKSILHVGLLLTKAKAALPHGEFGHMIKADLPFKAETAQRLMKVTRDKRFSNPAYAQDLPPSWYALYELTKLPDDRFKAAIEAGSIHAGMSQADAHTLVLIARAGEGLEQEFDVPRFGRRLREWQKQAGKHDTVAANGQCHHTLLRKRQAVTARWLEINLELAGLVDDSMAEGAVLARIIRLLREVTSTIIDIESEVFMSGAKGDEKKLIDGLENARTVLIGLHDSIVF